MGYLTVRPNVRRCRAFALSSLNKLHSADYRNGAAADDDKRDEWLRLEFEFAEERSKLAPHLAWIARDLPDHLTFSLHVVAGVELRHAHASTCLDNEDHPRQSNLARVLRGHYLALPAKSKTPLGRTRGVHDALEFTTT